MPDPDWKEKAKALMFKFANVEHGRLDVVVKALEDAHRMGRVGVWREAIRTTMTAPVNENRCGSGPGSIAFREACKTLGDIFEAKAKQIEGEKLDPTKKIDPEDTIQNDVHSDQKQDKNPRGLTALALVEWDKFDNYLSENIGTIPTEMYDMARQWLDSRTKDVTNLKIISNFKTFKEKAESDPYLQYHNSLIDACMGTLKTKDRKNAIKLINGIIAHWQIDGLVELHQATENQCLNILEEFDKIHNPKKESLEDVLENDYPPPSEIEEIPEPQDDDLPF